jgi:pimeloyl-ACP methyl ester carboxylesterase
VFDFNGFGESDRIDLSYWKDAVAVIRHVRQVKGTCAVALHGLSFGAFHVVRAIPELSPGAGVILENISRSLYDYWKRWFVTRIAVWLCERTGLQAAREMDIVGFFDQAARLDVRVLFIGCEEDTLTPVAEMRDLFEHVSAEKMFVQIRGAQHYMAPAADAASYWRGIRTILHVGGDEGG